MFAPHHDGSPLHVDTQRLELGDTVRVRLRVPLGAGGDGSAPLPDVRVRAVHDAEAMWIEPAHLGRAGAWEWWEAGIQVSSSRVRYRWMVEWPDGSPLAFQGARAGSQVTWLNQAGYSDDEPRDADDFALLATPGAPEWMHDAVMYQVFPDRFARSANADARETPDWAIAAHWDDPVDAVMPGRSQQFFGGDLDGVIERLEHIAALGVTLLYLTPVFPGASNHRYDATTFERVDPLLGGDEALIRLVEAAHALGIKVMGDLTSNHTGDTHEWFQAALRDGQSPEASFYYFDDARENYVGWLGHSTLPKLNWSSPALRERFVTGEHSVVRRFLEPPYSLDGWRIDVANMTGRLGSTDLNREVRGLIASTMRETNPDTLLLAESTNDATDDLQGDGWHGAMSYADFTRPLWAWLSEPVGEPYPGADGEMRTRPWFFGEPVSSIPQHTAQDFVRGLTRFTAGIPWRVRLGGMHPLDTHDTARFQTNAKPGSAVVAAGLQMTLPGIPVLFAGDEFGLVGAEGESSRTPIPWGTVAEPEVARRIDTYRELTALRASHSVLRDGGLRWVHASEHTLAFVRESAEESVLIVASSGADECEISVDLLPGCDKLAPLVAHGVELSRAEDGVRVRTQGPGFAAWKLAGVPLP